MSNIELSTDRIRSGGIIPILRGNFTAEEVVSIANVLVEGDIRIIEVTLNSENALELISRLRRQFDKTMLVGAGTVRTVQAYAQARSAGAEFTIAPNFDRLTVEAAIAEDVLHLPGVLTPTEAQQAAACGCKFVKLFPLDALGPKYLKAIRAPLHDTLFLPTGGVSLENIAAYRTAGAAAAGIGSALVRTGVENPEKFGARVAAFRKAWDSSAPAP